MKKAFCLLFALCLCLTSCGMPGKQEIRELVLENRELLESCAEKGDCHAVYVRQYAGNAADL